jgi:hypothetical protein
MARETRAVGGLQAAEKGQASKGGQGMALARRLFMIFCANVLLLFCSFVPILAFVDR